MIKMLVFLVWVLSEFALEVYYVGETSRDYTLLALKFLVYFLSFFFAFYWSQKNLSGWVLNAGGVYKLFLVWVVWQAVSSFWSPNFLVAFATAISRALLAYFVYTVVVDRGLNKFFQIAACALTFLISISVLFFLINPELVTIRSFDSSDSILSSERFRGFFGDPNALGRACALLIYFLVVLDFG